MHYNVNEFTDFLKNVNLEKYRERFSKIKTVEMDLPKNIQALDTIYGIYWNHDEYNNLSSPPQFDDYYDIYYKSCSSLAKEFAIKVGFGTSCDCFERGLKARIYRTWASLITQIHAGYVAESVFGKDSVKQGTELDHSDIDILANYKGNEIMIQVKKESHRPEIGRMHKGMEAVEENGIFNIWYVVPSPSDYLEKQYYLRDCKTGKQGELKQSLRPFVKFNKDGTLDRLDNGFVIFTKKEFEMIKETFK